MKRARLIVPQEYISALEEVLGLQLGDQYIRTREGKKALGAIADSVGELSKGLTQDRDQFLTKHYLKDPLLRKAYALYYTTTNFLKPYIPLKELFAGKEPGSTFRALDLGAGTGAATLGLLHYLRHSGYSGHVEVTLVDAVDQNLSEATRLLNSYVRSLPFTVAISTQTKNIIAGDLQLDAKTDLILMMNTLNEIGDDHDAGLMKMIAGLLTDDGSLMLIEPASRTASRRTLEFRDRAVLDGYTVYAPCTRQSSCPALVKETDWCHTEVDWQRPGFIEYIDDIAGTLRLSLKYTYVIVNRSGETLGKRLDQSQLSRVVSEVFYEKGRTRFILCNDAGRSEHVINKRDISPENAKIKELERYDLVEARNVEVREHDVRITGDSIFRIVLPKSGA